MHKDKSKFNTREKLVKIISVSTHRLFSSSAEFDTILLYSMLLNVKLMMEASVGSSMQGNTRLAFDGCKFIAR